MNKERFYQFIILGLIVGNIILASVLFFGGKKKGHHPHGPKHLIIQKLQFDEAQQVAYEGLIKSHRSLIGEKDGEIRSLKKALLSTLNRPQNNAFIDSISSEIGNIQKEIEIIHYNHFVSIKELCREDQLQNFESLSKELQQLFAPPPPPKR